jgi:ABC-type nitrate/sulfonate/bicarbonate transport system substrate-binding protein
MRKQFVVMGALALLIVVGGWYAISSKAPDNKQTTRGDMQSISVRMKWFYAGTMTGWFAGKEQGIFKEAGLNIAMTPGGPDNNSVKLVAAGTDTFGVAGADEVLMAREKGIPIVAVGVLFKDSPICFISKKDKGIMSPSQWSGKTVEVSYGSNAEVQYRALIKKFGVKDVKEVPYTFNLIPFIENKVDVSVAYRMDQVVTLEQRGILLNIIAPKEYGINPYGDVIITTEKTLRENPELVHRFVQAAVKSFQWSIEHPQEAVAVLVKNAPELKMENELEVWKATIPFLTVDGGIAQVGVMKTQRWQETLDSLVEFGAVKAPMDLQKAYQNVTQGK